MPAWNDQIEEVRRGIRARESKYIGLDRQFATAVGWRKIFVFLQGGRPKNWFAQRPY